MQMIGMKLVNRFVDLHGKFVFCDIKKKLLNKGKYGNSIYWYYL
jgi:hypothetical protein